MPPVLPVPPGSIIAATITFIYASAECQHKFHFRTKELFADMETACVFVLTNIITPFFLPHMVAAVELRSVLCHLVGGEFFDSAVLFPQEQTFGALPELGAAPIVANVMQLRSVNAGRRHRGRLYLFGFPLAYIENYNHLSPYAFTVIRNMGNDLENEFRPEGSSPWITLGVFSYADFQAGSSAELAFSPLRLINVQSRLSSMSKRRF
jgi:hypothetical protein